MIIGNVYTYLFSANDGDIRISDIRHRDNVYRTTGVFVGMTCETSYCIFANKFDDGYRIHYVLIEQVDTITHPAKSWKYNYDLASKLVQSTIYNEPPCNYSCTPVLFIRDRPIGSTRLEKPMYCDMV